MHAWDCIECSQMCCIEYSIPPCTVDSKKYAPFKQTPILLVYRILIQGGKLPTVSPAWEVNIVLKSCTLVPLLIVIFMVKFVILHQTPEFFQACSITHYLLITRSKVCFSQHCIYCVWSETMNTSLIGSHHARTKLTSSLLIWGKGFSGKVLNETTIPDLEYVFV